MANEVKKEYVAILAQINLDGSIQPLCVLLQDGRKYDIDEIKDKCRAASLKAGGCGLRYTIRIGTKDTYLFDEDGRWFVEMRAERTGYGYVQREQQQANKRELYSLTEVLKATELIAKFEEQLWNMVVKNVIVCELGAHKLTMQINLQITQWIPTNSDKVRQES